MCTDRCLSGMVSAGHRFVGEHRSEAGATSPQEIGVLSDTPAPAAAPLCAAGRRRGPPLQDDVATRNRCPIGHLRPLRTHPCTSRAGPDGPPRSMYTVTRNRCPTDTPAPAGRPPVRRRRRRGRRSPRCSRRPARAPVGALPSACGRRLRGYHAVRPRLGLRVATRNRCPADTCALSGHIRAHLARALTGLPRSMYTVTRNRCPIGHPLACCRPPVRRCRAPSPQEIGVLSDTYA